MAEPVALNPIVPGGECVRRFDLLACAWAGRTVRVTRGAGGEPAWTDGVTIVIDPDSGEHDHLAAVAVQSCLIAAGSLDPQIVHGLRRRPKLAARYLAVEGHRALQANLALLPPTLHRLIDHETARRTTSPAASLAWASARRHIDPAPAAFGVIRVKDLLAAATTRGDDREAEHRHTPIREPRRLAELDDEDELATDDAGAAADMFSVGGASTPLGRLLGRFLKSLRSGEGNGSPAGDTPTHIGRHTTARRGIAVLSAATAAVPDDAATSGTGAFTYPEWDLTGRRYRPDWCTVTEHDPPRPAGRDIPAVLDTAGLRRSLARLVLGLDQCHRQPHGDDIDIDAAIDARVHARTSASSDENLYIAGLRRRRDLSVLVLLDISGSAGEPDGRGTTVHDRQRAAAAAITGALYDLGDRVGLYAYNSHGRAAVNIYPVKRFNDRFNPATMQRLHALAPGAYSRLGAAIRHGASILREHGGTTRRLLIVLSDGLAYDHGYTKDHGAADSRRALAETRRQGTGALCLTFGAHTDAVALQKVFGTAAHASVSSHTQLADAVAALVQTALRSADLRRTT